MGASQVCDAVASVKCPAPQRHAMTLLEMAVVVFIVGLLGLMAVTRYGTNTLADVDAQGFARRLVLDCGQARRRAIATGDNHLIRFSFSGGASSQYAIYRRSGATTTLVDSLRFTPSQVSLTTTATDLEFTFTGESLASYTVAIQAPDRTWTITIPQVTGKAFIH